MDSIHHLHDAADENLAVHATWATSCLPLARVQRAPDLVLVDSGLACDTFNFACRARISAGRAEERVAEARDFFRVTDHPFSWWLGPGFTPPGLPEVLARHGLEQAESEIAMAIDLARLPQTVPAVPSLTITPVRNHADLAAFAEMSAANWDPPDQDVLGYYREVSGVLLDPDAPRRLYLGRVDGEPAATAEATVGGGVVGLYNISTRPTYRGRGIGLAMVHAPLAAAITAGLSTGILQATAAGLGVYERLGFRSFGAITEFKPRHA
jgi:GNAT superfamily N-acetyltransferase